MGDFDEFDGLGSTLYANINGNGHTIKNIVVNVNSDLTVFDLSENSSIYSLNFSNCNITVDGSFILIDNAPTVLNIVWDNTNIVTTTNNIYMFHKSSTVTNSYSYISVSGKLIASGTLGVFYTLRISSSSRAYGECKNCFITANIQNAGNVILFYVVSVYNCFARSNVTVSGSNTFRFASAGNATLKMYYCYNASTVSANTVYGLSSNGTIISSFYDNDKITNATDTDNGQPTANLKDADWLRGQNWAI
jgi:hypothetical protein